MLRTVESKYHSIDHKYNSIKHHLLSKVGNTPLFELKKLAQDLRPVRIYAKAEWFNPGGSIKDRAALNMINQGIRKGKLDKSKIILDASSGNTGIAYARDVPDRHNRFLIPPHEYLAAEKIVGEEGYTILGFYHSHPEAEASPSHYDLDHSWPWYSYIIVSIKGKKAEVVNSWLLEDDRSKFVKEEIRIKELFVEK